MTKAPGNGGDTVNIPADGIRQSVPWKLRSDELEQELIEREVSLLEGRGGWAYDERGRLVEHEAFSDAEMETLPERVAEQLSKIDLVDALTTTEVQELAKQFVLSADALSALSKDLARALDTKITPVFSPLPRQKAIARAQKDMQSAVADIMSASEHLLRGFERLEHLDTAEAGDRHGAKRFDMFRKDYDQVLRDVETLHRKLKIIAETPDAALDLRPSDRRAVGDLRRTAVLSCLFAFWESAGRKLTITNDAVQNRRSGLLIDFVNAVVRSITEPSSTLSSETIHDELKRYKRSKRGS